MTNPEISYNFKKDDIFITYNNKNGDIIEKPITEQTLSAAFDYFYAKGIVITGHCEYKALGRTFKVSLVDDNKSETKGKWIESDCFDVCFWVCSNCGFPSQATAAPELYKFCPNCGKEMDGYKANV